MLTASTIGLQERSSHASQTPPSDPADSCSRVNRVKSGALRVPTDLNDRSRFLQKSPLGSIAIRHERYRVRPPTSPNPARAADLSGRTPHGAPGLARTARIPVFPLASVPAQTRSEATCGGRLALLTSDCVRYPGRDCTCLATAQPEFRCPRAAHLVLRSDQRPGSPARSSARRPREL